MGSLVVRFNVNFVDRVTCVAIGDIATVRLRSWSMYRTSVLQWYGGVGSKYDIYSIGTAYMKIRDTWLMSCDQIKIRINTFPRESLYKSIDFSFCGIRVNSVIRNDGFCGRVCAALDVHSSVREWCTWTSPTRNDSTKLTSPASFDRTRNTVIG